MRPYSELEQLAPTAYLEWEQFQTDFDGLEANVARQEENHQRGIDIGNRSAYVCISATGVWGAKGKDGSHTASYEGIGYHAGTAYLLKGFLDSGVPIVVYRRVPYGSGRPTSQWIKGSQEEANARITSKGG